MVQPTQDRGSPARLALDALSRELGVSLGRLVEWRDEAVAVSQATSPSAKKPCGVRTSMRRVLRIMREHGLLTHHRSVAMRGP